MHEGTESHDKLAVEAIIETTVAREDIVKVLNLVSALHPTRKEPSKGSNQRREYRQEYRMEVNRRKLQCLGYSQALKSLWYIMNNRSPHTITGTCLEFKPLRSLSVHSPKIAGNGQTHIMWANELVVFHEPAAELKGPSESGSTNDMEQTKEEELTRMLNTMVVKRAPMKPSHVLLGERLVKPDWKNFLPKARPQK